MSKRGLAAWLALFGLSWGVPGAPAPLPQAAVGNGAEPPHAAAGAPPRIAAGELPQAAPTAPRPLRISAPAFGAQAEVEVRDLPAAAAEAST